MTTRLIVGCMTGTSIDAIDAAVVRVEGTGLAMRAGFVRGRSRALGDLAGPLRGLAEQEAMTAGRIAGLARDFSLAHAAAVLEVLAVEREKPALICVHGQTVFHRPPVSWQMFNPWPLCREIGVPVVFDLRGADLAAGGQGAPITPLADWVLFRQEGVERAIVNLGGFCNYTIVRGTEERDPGREIDGGDVCACNLLLDAIARKLLGVPFDADGRAAMAGGVNEAALEDLGGVLASQARAGRSLGTGDEVIEWVSRWRAHIPPDDIAATACEGLGQRIARRVQGAGEVYLAGGGAKNRALVRAIESWASAPVKGLEALGVPGEFREAAEFAVLGALCQDRVPITLPRITGVAAPAPVAGAWVYP